jgi:hypothetical protein
MMAFAPRLEKTKLRKEEKEDDKVYIDPEVVR